MDIDMPPVNRVDEIHDKLKSLEGQRIKVRANMGRSRIVEGTGVLVQVHPSLFVVEIEERQSYQYVDVLTGGVEVFDADTGERLFDYVAEE